MAKNIKHMTICRNGSNRPTAVRILTDADFVYTFDVAPQLSDRHILALIGRLVDFEERGDQVKRNRRR
ncbi:hypothetical protein [Cohnella lupini]|uniref:hypothetical protein n=1 Tax=Cohnella lupini TaxID=1294267 RepID=UPI000E2786E7|nr:hypothetical protein [Cohnella lupini]